MNGLNHIFRDDWARKNKGSNDETIKKELEKFFARTLYVLSFYCSVYLYVDNEDQGEFVEFKEYFKPIVVEEKTKKSTTFKIHSEVTYEVKFKSN